MVHSRLSDSGNSRSVQSVLAHLRSNPKVVVHLGRLSMLASESACSRAMVERVLSQDVHANARLCDALSGGMFSEVGLTYASLPQAIDALGLPTVVYAAQVMTVYALAQLLLPASGLSPIDFLRHAFATSGAAAALAPECNIALTRAQTAGLVHNLGILFAAGAFPEDYKNLSSLLQGEKTMLYVAETTRFGFDHQAVAKAALPTYGFEPDVVTASAEHHQDPENLSPLSRCVGLAALVSDQLGCTVGIGGGRADVDQSTIERYGFSEGQLGLAATSVSDSISRMSRCPA